MVEKSDFGYASGPERISATEASRSFARVLDAVARGHRFIVERRGEYVCEIAPPQQRARRLSESLALVQGRAGVLLDEGFGDDLEDLISREAPEQDLMWDS